MAALLTGSVAIVTGGASGLGRAIVQRFAEEGAAAIVVADLTDEPNDGGESAVELATRAGAQATFVRTDVRRPDDFAAAIAAADSFGGVSVMVNNAGVFRLGDFLQVTEADYDLVMAVNAKGVFFGGQAAARAMLARGTKGSIINMSSFGGILGNGAAVAYNASKGAVRLATYAMAHALGPSGIRVNAIHPGSIETEMTKGQTVDNVSWKFPLGRLGAAIEVANTAVFLASDLASYTTGSSFLVDGGVTNTA